jgi:hypothetical protein
MATIAQHTVVRFKRGVDLPLRFRPAGGGRLVVAVETGALKAPENNLTTVVEVTGLRIAWVGSIDESMVDATDERHENARQELSRLVLQGNATWTIVSPGMLRYPGTGEMDTVYQGDRPWVMIGGPHECGLLAVPLNDLGKGAHPYYQCAVQRADLQLPSAKDSKLELGHVWSFPKEMERVGEVLPDARTAITAALKRYYPGGE